MAGLLCSQMKARGKFIGDKIDMLVSYLIVHPFLRLYEKLPQAVRVGPICQPSQNNTLVGWICHAPYRRLAPIRHTTGCMDASTLLHLHNHIIVYERTLKLFLHPMTSTPTPWQRVNGHSIVVSQDKAPRMAVDVQEHVQDGGLGEHHGGGPGFYGPQDSSKPTHEHAHAKVRSLALACNRAQCSLCNHTYSQAAQISCDLWRRDVNLESLTFVHR